MPNLLIIDNDTQASGSGGYDFNNLTPVAWIVNQNNVPLSSGGGYRVNATTDIDVTGFAAGADDHRMLLFNSSTVNKNVKLKHNNTNSAVGNRILGTGQSDLTILPYMSVMIRYDATLAAWHIYGVGQH